MKNDNNIPQQSYNSNKSQKYVLTSPTRSPKYHLLFKDNNYLLKSKHVFKFEKKRKKKIYFKYLKKYQKSKLKKSKLL